ncbi:LysM peptidoglycan-binding domain-containing protein [Vannielia sp.]|uniref:LysM peptidoglycan-binding domain-containing protein n=1 Tax=Vannielia sp. TaxID=2813045 RepID=UPI002639AD83|nr:LysM peptidoglycan-binding domain-containing protein [Vannielia sp.]MDF1873598.1 LysM peptidoglycan-binding domain-containing protein [Vannielia sp.]
MLRAIVVVSALLTATLATVLFMPGIGRDETEAVSKADLAASEAELAAIIADQQAPEPVTTPDAPADVAADVAAKPAAADPLQAAVNLAIAGESDTAKNRDMATLGANVLSGLDVEKVQDLKADPAERTLYADITGENPYLHRQELSQGTDYVLAALGAGPRTRVDTTNTVHEFTTDYVLAGLGGSATEPSAAEQSLKAALAPGNIVKLEDIVTAAMQEGQSDEYLIALIDGLSAAGQLDAPAALMNTNGQVDTDLVLSALVRASTQLSTRKAPKSRPELSLAEPVVHTVRSGESLATIAFRYYGRIAKYDAIYRANLDQISSPDRINVGQRLTIPAG